MNDPDSFDLFIEKSIPQFAHLFKPAVTSVAPPDFTRAAGLTGGSAEEIAICEQLGLKPGTLRD